MRLSKYLLFSTLTCILCVSCRDQAAEAPMKREILIYCGITMAQPIQEIAEIIEESHNCIVKIIKGGSGSLYRAILENKVGDLYLPGVPSYMHTCLDEGLVSRSVKVGVNRAAMIVRAGNPLGLTANLKHFTDKQLRIVLASAESGSIGRETKQILQAANIYADVKVNTLFFTTDSKNLTRTLRNDEADLSINWAATAYWKENRNDIEALFLDSYTAQPRLLLLGQLKYAAFPDIAGAFIDYAVSAQGQAIFQKYGFIE